MKELKNEEDLILYLNEQQTSGDACDSAVARIAKDLLPPFAKVLSKELRADTEPEFVVRAFVHIMGSILYNVTVNYSKPGTEPLVAMGILKKIQDDMIRMLKEEIK